MPSTRCRRCEDPGRTCRRHASPRRSCTQNSRVGERQGTPSRRNEGEEVISDTSSASAAHLSTGADSFDSLAVEGSQTSLSSQPLQHLDGAEGPMDDRIDNFFVQPGPITDHLAYAGDMALLTPHNPWYPVEYDEPGYGYAVDYGSYPMPMELSAEDMSPVVEVLSDVSLEQIDDEQLLSTGRWVSDSNL